MSKTIVWNNIFLVVLLWNIISIAPVCGWLTAPSGPAKQDGRRLFQVQSCRPPRPHSATTLFKKKGGGSSTTTANKKLQVKLLKHVPGTGQAGEVILVTPAFFNNRLRPTGLAKEISDETVEQERLAQTAKQQQQDESAIQLMERIESLKLTMRRKVGPSGQLFGGVGPKMVMEELYAAIPDDFLKQKNVKITTMVDLEGKTFEGDIKTIGTFTATVSLTKERFATLRFTIEAEESL